MLIYIYIMPRRKNTHTHTIHTNFSLMICRRIALCEFAHALSSGLRQNSFPHSKQDFTNAANIVILILMNENCMTSPKRVENPELYK